MSSNVLQSARLISVLTLASRLLGLVRDIAFARAFGVTPEKSAFDVAFQIPNLFRRLFGEGALSAASIPVLTDALARGGRASMDTLSGRLLGLLLIVLTVICVAAEGVVAGLYWRYGGDSDTRLMLAMTALMLPYLIFICTAATLGGIQNVCGRFASAASAPIILNVFLIAGALGGPFIFPGLRREIVVVSASVVISGIFQLAWQWLATWRCGLRLPLRISTSDPDIRRIMVTTLPMIVGLATVQINTMADSLIAWWFVPGRSGPAILSTAQRLYQFPLGVFAIALATAIFPTMSRHATEGDLAGLNATLAKGIRVASFEGIPCLVGLILIREPLIRTLFDYGRFRESPDAVARVSLALYMYALGIWAFGVNQLITRAFYAVKDARTPLGVSVRNVGLNLVLNLVLVQTRMRESGLALATSICAVLQVIVLLRKYSRRVGPVHWRVVGESIARTAAATAIMGMVVWVVDHRLNEAGPALRLAAMVVAGAVSFLAAAFVLRCEELREMARR